MDKTQCEIQNKLTQLFDRYFINTKHTTNPLAEQENNESSVLKKTEIKSSSDLIVIDEDQNQSTKKKQLKSKINEKK